MKILRFLNKVSKEKYSKSWMFRMDSSILRKILDSSLIFLKFNQMNICNINRIIFKKKK